jgi:inner membrane protein
MACFGHVALGLMAGRFQDEGRSLQARPRSRAATLITFGVLGMLPDFDVFAVVLGAGETTAAGHRGGSHSLLTALAIGIAGGLLARRYGWNGLRTALALMLAVGSHGLIDCLANGGRAIPLFWPLTAHRFSSPLRLFPDAPRGVAFISRHGLSVAAIEFVYFLPITLYALWPRSRAGTPVLQILTGGAGADTNTQAEPAVTDGGPPPPLRSLG